jgi:hypothetical protein
MTAFRERLRFSLLGMLLLVPVVSASSEPMAASGTFVVTKYSILSTRSSGGNTILTVTHTSEWTGSFKGRSVIENEKIVIHPDGSATDRGFGTFVTDDGMGTAAHSYFAVGHIGPGGLFDTSNTEIGLFSMDNGTGTLEGVHARGTFNGVFGGTYEGIVRIKDDEESTDEKKR